MITDITARKRDEEARERFIAILGHDLKGPLSAILLGAFYLLRSEALPGSLRAAVRGMMTSAERMVRLIEDVLDLARGRLGSGLPIERRPCDIGALCRELVAELATAYPERDLTLSIAGDLAGRWDRDRLAQLVSNLLGNALTHGQDPIRVTVLGASEGVVLEVANRGAPIPEALLPELFEPFRRGAEGRGLGLGLFIVQEIARSHGGVIEVRSSAEAGTAFTVRLPREDAPRAD
jgi:signal transduction histidine kinase